MGGQYDPITQNIGGIQSMGGGVFMVDGQQMTMSDLMMKLNGQRTEILDSEIAAQMNQIKERNILLGSLQELYKAIHQLSNQTPLLSPTDALARLQNKGALQLALSSMGVPSTSMQAADWYAAFSQSVKSQMDQVNSDAQLDMIRLQTLTNKRNQAFEMMSNILAKINGTKGSVIGNMRSESQYDLGDDGYLYFGNLAPGKHTLSLYDDAGIWLSSVYVQLDNDPSQPRSTEWTRGADGVWMFNMAGMPMLLSFDLDLVATENGYSDILLSGGVCIDCPVVEPAAPPIWPYILIVGVLLAAIGILLVIQRRRRMLDRPKR